MSADGGDSDGEVEVKEEREEARGRERMEEDGRG